MEGLINSNFKNNTQIKKGDVIMKTEIFENNKFRNDEDYYSFINLVREKFNNHEIDEDTKNKVIQLATLEESNRRRKAIEENNRLFGTNNIKEGELGYYQQCIENYIDDKYIKCEYTFEENEIASSVNYSELIFSLNGKDRQKKDEMNKIIYQDLLSGKLDLLHTSGKELIEMYGKLV